MLGNDYELDITNLKSLPPDQFKQVNFDVWTIIT